MLEEAKNSSAIQTIMGKLVFCCLLDYQHDAGFLFAEIRSVRIRFWEKSQEERHQYLMDLVLLCPGKEKRESLASKSGSVFVFPVLLGYRCCTKCSSTLLGCSSSFIYKVKHEVDHRLLRSYVNGNRTLMKDESKGSEKNADCHEWFDLYFSTIGDYMPHFCKVHLPPALYKDMHAIYLADIYDLAWGFVHSARKA